MTTPLSSSTANTHDASAFFSAIIDGLTNDKFMGFIDAWLDNYTLLSGKGFIDWPEASSAAPFAASSSLSSELCAYTNTHFAIFQNYQTIFESRLRSMIVGNQKLLMSLSSSSSSSSASGSSDITVAELQTRFYEICAEMLAAKDQQKKQQPHSSRGVDDEFSPPVSVSKRIKTSSLAENTTAATISSSSSSSAATTADLVETLLLIIQTVGNFGSFSAMMYDRQQEGLDSDE